MTSIVFLANQFVASVNKKISSNENLKRKIISELLETNNEQLFSLIGQLDERSLPEDKNSLADIYSKICLETKDIDILDCLPEKTSSITVSEENITDYPWFSKLYLDN